MNGKKCVETNIDFKLKSSKSQKIVFHSKGSFDFFYSLLYDLFKHPALYYIYMFVKKDCGFLECPEAKKKHLTSNMITF